MAAPVRGRTLALYNPGSGRARRRPEAVRPLVEALGPDAVRIVASPADVPRALHQLRPDETDVLVVIGGDGTVHALLTALHGLLPRAPWPRLVPVPAGSTNMTAADLGATGSLSSHAFRLADWVRGGTPGGREEVRPLLRIESPGREALCGTFFGGGIISHGVRHFQGRLRGVGPAGESTSLLSVVRLLGLLLLRDPEQVGALPVSTRLDGRETPCRDLLLCLASTLDRLLLGTRPYWGTEGGPIHYTEVRTDARGLWLALPRVALGRPGGRLTPEAGYLSRDAHCIELRFDGPFVVDGELYEARSREGPVKLTSPRTIRWLCPA